MPFRIHLKSYKDLITPYEKTRAGFIALALEKNRKATPFIEEAKVLKALALKAEIPRKLLLIHEIENSLLTAAGISEKAKNHLQEEDKKEAIKGLIDNFLEPAGSSFIEELVYRFLLTRGDALGGSIRNLSGALGEWRFTRIFISTCSVGGMTVEYLDAKSRKWMRADTEPEIEKRIKGLHWLSCGNPRTLIYNLTVPTVQKNVDLCLFDCSPDEIIFGKNKESVHFKSKKYLALGELKGGIDPAGADEHWKTANSALERIRKAFSGQNCRPRTFFVGAAIEHAMAEEIFQQLDSGRLSNAANLTDEKQVVSLCDWLIKL
ncbi:MAG: AvaI/BsoBI family type II restriction endonuclease [Candidatus Electrothrix sp. YB6]